MNETLTPAELTQLVRRVFSPTPADTGLAPVSYTHLTLPTNREV